MVFPADVQTYWWQAGSLNGNREVILTSHRTDDRNWLVVHQYHAGRFVSVDEITLPYDRSWVPLIGRFHRADGEIGVYNMGTGEYLILGERS